MIRIFALMSLMSLTACGVDGEPVAPTASGVTVSGDVSVGVVVKP